MIFMIIRIFFILCLIKIIILYSVNAFAVSYISFDNTKSDYRSLFDNLKCGLVDFSVHAYNSIHEIDEDIKVFIKMGVKSYFSLRYYIPVRQNVYTGQPKKYIGTIFDCGSVNKRAIILHTICFDERVRIAATVFRLKYDPPGISTWITSDYRVGARIKLGCENEFESVGVEGPDTVRLQNRNDDEDLPFRFTSLCNDIFLELTSKKRDLATLNLLAGDLRINSINLTALNGAFDPSLQLIGADVNCQNEGQLVLFLYGYSVDYGLARLVQFTIEINQAGLGEINRLDTPLDLSPIREQRFLPN